MIDNPATISIIGTTSNVNGKLEVNIIPVDEDGESEVPEEIYPDDPKDLSNFNIL